MIWILDQTINERACGFTPKSVSVSLDIDAIQSFQLIDVVINNTCEIATMFDKVNRGSKE